MGEVKWEIQARYGNRGFSDDSKRLSIMASVQLYQYRSEVTPSQSISASRRSPTSQPRHSLIPENRTTVGSTLARLLPGKEAWKPLDNSRFPSNSIFKNLLREIHWLRSMPGPLLSITGHYVCHLRTAPITGNSSATVNWGNGRMDD